MITRVFATIASDLMHAVEDESFFKHSKDERKKLVDEKLEKYPGSLKQYLIETSEEAFARDFTVIAPIFGGSNSIMNEIASLRSSTNGLFEAFMQFLEKDFTETLEHTGSSTRLHAYLGSVSDGRTRKVLIREAQETLLLGRGIDSPRAQIAKELSEEELTELRTTLQEKTGGIPSVHVNESLLGGVKVFRSGRVIDASWRSRISNLFSHLS